MSPNYLIRFSFQEFIQENLLSLFFFFIMISGLLYQSDIIGLISKWILIEKLKTCSSNKLFWSHYMCGIYILVRFKFINQDS